MTDRQLPCKHRVSRRKSGPLAVLRSSNSEIGVTRGWFTNTASHVRPRAGIGVRYKWVISHSCSGADTQSVVHPTDSSCAGGDDISPTKWSLQWKWDVCMTSRLRQDKVCAVGMVKSRRLESRRTASTALVPQSHPSSRFAGLSTTSWTPCSTINSLTGPHPRNSAPSRFTTFNFLIFYSSFNTLSPGIRLSGNRRPVLHHIRLGQRHRKKAADRHLPPARPIHVPERPHDRRAARCPAQTQGQGQKARQIPQAAKQRPSSFASSFALAPHAHTMSPAYLVATQAHGGSHRGGEERGRGCPTPCTSLSHAPRRRALRPHAELHTFRARRLRLPSGPACSQTSACVSYRVSAPPVSPYARFT